MKDFDKSLTGISVPLFPKPQILEEVAPTKIDNEEAKVVSIKKGRPGMDQWSILVLGTLRLGLNADYDRILELAN